MFYEYAKKIFSFIFSLFILGFFVLPVDNVYGSFTPNSSVNINNEIKFFCMDSMNSFWVGSNTPPYTPCSESGVILDTSIVGTFGVGEMYYDDLQILWYQIQGTENYTVIDPNPPTPTPTPTQPFLPTTSVNSIMSDLGTAVNSVFDGLFPYMMITMGLLVAWYVIRQIMYMLYLQKNDKINRIVHLKRKKGYKILKGNQGQDVGYEKKDL